MIDRNKAFEISNDGLLLENGGHFASGTSAPTHSGLAGDWYFQTTDATLWRLAANGTDWARLSAPDIPFIPAASSLRSTNVSDVLKELRQTIVYEPDELTSSLDGTHQIAALDNSLHIVSGSATGYSIKLPDATTQFKGVKYEVANQSSQPISIKDFNGGSLATLNPADVLIATLQSNSTAAGVWVLLSISSIASGVQAFNVTASSEFSTDSVTDILLTGLSITPSSGTWGVWFSANIVITANNRIAECTVYKDGVAVEDTRRDVQGVGSNYKSNFQTLGIISVNGSQALDIRVNITAGSLNITGRSFLIIRLGAA